MSSLVAGGILPELPVKDYLAATSIGIVDGELYLDLAYDEDSRAEVDMNIVMTGNGNLVEIQGTAEKAPFSRQKMNEMLDLAETGIRKIIGEQKRILLGCLA